MTRDAAPDEATAAAVRGISNGFSPTRALTVLASIPDPFGQVQITTP